MVEPKLISFVKKMLQDGVPVKTIFSSLKEKGWSDGDISNAVKEAVSSETIAAKTETPLSKTYCWSCGKDNAADASFCQKCGADLNETDKEHHKKREKMAEHKRVISFGTIIGIIGTVLIGCGIAWLIASNWHHIPAPLKIMILLSFTFGCYIISSLLKIRGYKSTEKVLSFLGSVLYTLSVILIAQIFNTKVGAQGWAWILLLCLIGVGLASYILVSYLSLLLGMVQFLFWTVIQYVALHEKGFDPTPGIFAFIFLAAGVFFYGLSLLHKSKSHIFAKVYKWWTLFYFLAFTYVLSFQTVIPYMWPKGLTSSTTDIVLLIVIALVSLACFMMGVITALNSRSVDLREVYGIMIIVGLLIILIFSTSVIGTTLGYCHAKHCNEFKDEASCENALHYAQYNNGCAWISANSREYCSEKTCSMYNDQELSCNDNPDLRCEFHPSISEPYQKQGAWCGEIACSEYNNTESCENAPKNPKCVWYNNMCDPITSCFIFRDKDSCEKISTCEWDGSSNNCVKEKVCENYNNKRAACLDDKRCDWQTTGSSWYTSSKKAPLSLWLIWIFVNIVLLGLIIGIIGYGTWTKSRSMVNLGIRFFMLDVLTRYIGFILDLKGYLSLSIIFIVGGIILLIGGWFIEKWRKKLVAKIREESISE